MIPQRSDRRKPYFGLVESSIKNRGTSATQGKNGMLKGGKLTQRSSPLSMENEMGVRTINNTPPKVSLLSISYGKTRKKAPPSISIDS